MTREEAWRKAKGYLYDVLTGNEADEIIKALEQDEDCVSRKAVLKIYDEWFATRNIADKKESPKSKIKALPPVTPQPKIGHCKDCKYFEYNSVANVCGLPLIVAHEICNKWGDGCKTNENGYCFLFEPQESEDGE